jgi:glycine cleavage system transcriptional repressor
VSYLLITVVYKTQSEITEAIFSDIGMSQCRVMDSRLLSAGTDHTVLTLVIEGNWNQLTRVKTNLEVLKEQYSLTTVVQTVDKQEHTFDTIPYSAYVIMPDTASDLSKVVQCFLSFPIRLQTLSVAPYLAPMTQALMMEVHLVFTMLPGKPMSHYRESILQFCDDNNFEVLLEPQRN